VDVYFLRHGVAVEPEQWAGGDFDRPLTGKGIERMQREARAIRRIVGDLDAIVTSPLARAKTTAQIVAAQHDRVKAPVEDERLGGGFGVDHLAAILDEHQECATILLVGHEPSLRAVIGALIGRASVEMKKGALAGIEVRDASSPRGTLICLIPPKVLAAAGSRDDE
jgi:phosphohistidine phosphatase